MIIPRSSSSKIKEGDKVVLTKDVMMGHYIVTTGHILIYVGPVENYSNSAILKDEETGLILKDVDTRSFSKWVETVEEGWRIQKNISDRYKFMKFIPEHCPHKDYTYEDRDKVDICRPRANERRTDNYGWKYCRPEIDCFQHIPEEEYINNSFILEYNRKMKLSKLSKKIEK